MKIYTILLTILPLFVFSQFDTKDFDVDHSTPYKVIDAYSKYYFNKGNDVLMIKRTKKSIIMQKYDASSKKEVFKKEYPYFKEGAIDAIREIGDKIYLFKVIKDKKAKTTSLSYFEIDFENAKMGKENKIFKINEYRYGFSYSSSYDDSRLIVKYRKKRTIKNDKLSTDIIGMYILDKDLKEEWSGEVKMPYTEAEMNNIDYDIDGLGNAYILAEVFDSEVSKKYVKGERNYHLEMLKITDGDVEIIKINNSKNHISNIWMKEGPYNTMYLAGYYNEERDYYKSIDGVFVMTLSDDGSLENTSFHKIPLSIINMYQKEKVQKKNKKKQEKGKLDFESLVLDKIHIQDDGSVVLIGEQYYVTTHTYTDSNGNTRTTYRYHYNDILVTKINVDGELEWMKKLPKSQIGSSGQGGMSYKHIVKDDNHYFFYLDHIENIDLPKDKKPKTHSDGKGGIFTAYTISDDDGDVEKTSLLNFKETTIDGVRKPIALYQFSINRILETESGLVFEAYKKGKEDIMIHVDFE